MEGVNKLVDAITNKIGPKHKSKLSKMLKTVLDTIGSIPGTESNMITVLESLIDWATKENTSYLRHRFEIRLANLHLVLKKESEALKISEKLLPELKKIDDKLLQVEVFLIECKAHHALGNHTKAKASLSAARSNANSVYSSPLLQSDIDLITGIIYSDESDFKTAASYFYEAFETFNQNSMYKEGLQVLKYMIMCKIMLNATDEVTQLMTGKNGIKYSGKDLDAMRAMMKAHKNQSLVEFHEVLKAYPQGTPSFLSPIIFH
jgi:26S proteasome regulatory subunit N6